MIKSLPSIFFLYKTSALVGASVLILIVFLINSGKAVKYFDDKMQSRARWLVQEFDILFIEINIKTANLILYLSTFGIGFLVFILLLPNVIAGIIVGISIGFSVSRLPEPIIQMLKTRRAVEFNLQMVDALTLMSNGLRSGLNLVQSVELVVQEMPAPLKEEFNLLLAQNRVGVPIDEAFMNLAKRLEIDDLDMFATSILILRETGGNLPETFDTIVETIRERIKLSAKIKALTAQGIFQAIVITVIPFILLAIQYAANPKRVGLFFSTPLGYVMLSTMFILQGLGGFMIKKIVTIEV